MPLKACDHVQAVAPFLGLGLPRLHLCGSLLEFQSPELLTFTHPFPGEVLPPGG